MRRRDLLAAGLTPMLSGTADAAAPLTLLPPGGDAVFERAYFGLHVHNEGSTRNWPEIGIGALRLWDADVSWAYLERVQGRFDFRRLDEYLDWAKARGVEVLLPLGVTPPWASARPQEDGAYGKGTAAEPADIDSWRRYVRAVATHAKGRVAAYQVWNEANERIFFSGTPAALAQLMVAAAEEVRRVDAGARLVAPSAVGLDDRVLWPSRLLRQDSAHVTAKAVDAVAFHLYHSGHPPESMIAPVQRLRAAQAAAGLGQLPLWNTESGYWMPNVMVEWSPDERRNMITEELAAAYLPRDLILARALGVERFFWYAWDGSKMGLISPLTKRLRPPALAYRQCIRALAGTTLQRCTRAASGVWTAQLRTADGAPMLALWLDATAGVETLRVPTPLAGARRSLLLDGSADWRAAPAQLELGAAVTLLTEAA